MDISVNRKSEVPLHEQIFAQLVFLIGTRRLKPGDMLPSVRALAKRLKIHYNTVSQAYHEMASAGFLTGTRGGQLVVRFPQEPPAPRRQPQDLDDLINEVIKVARRQGVTLQQLVHRVRERLLEASPDRVLVISEEPAMQALMRAELTEALKCPVETCSTADLSANSALAIGALVLAPPGTLPKATPLLPKNHPSIPIQYNEGKEALEAVRSLAGPCLVAVVSISQYFLDISRGVLSPIIGDRHSVSEYLVTGEGTFAVGAADIVICDRLAHRRIRVPGKGTRVVPHRLLSGECIEQVRSMIAKPATGAAPRCPPQPRRA